MIDRRMIPALGKEISRLGYGGMRFPKNGDEVDVDAAVQLLRKAYEMGINYFDTAMVYHKGESEKIFGKAFEPYPRDSYLIADKMSIWLCSDEEDMKARFYNQLKTLKTDYIDFYLVHSLNRNHYKKVKDLHCVEFLQQMKQEGKIKHLGFSFHDTYQVFTQILNDYTWDFVQIQLNYLDWHNQGAEQLYRELERRNLPVMVSRSFFADSSIHACLFRSLLLRLLSFDFSLCIFLAQAGQYFDMPERGTYSTPHTVQFLGFNAVHRFVGVICNSPTKPMNL